MRPVVKIGSWFVGYDGKSPQTAVAYTYDYDRVVFSEREGLFSAAPEKEQLYRPGFVQSGVHSIESRQALFLRDLIRRSGPEIPVFSFTKRQVLNSVKQLLGVAGDPSDQALLLALPCMRPSIWQVSQFLFWQRGKPPPRLLPVFEKFVLEHKDNFQRLATECSSSGLVGLAAPMAVMLERRLETVLLAVPDDCAQNIFDIVSDTPYGSSTKFVSGFNSYTSEQAVLRNG